MLLEPLEKPLDSELCRSLAECFAPSEDGKPVPLRTAEAVSAGRG